MIRAAFIGVNKHNDPMIRELTGAVRDATAFWALVSDTLPDAQCELITDNAATVENVRRIVDSLLTNASPDDIVIIVFSGHGTKTHRLVTYDTDRMSLEETTIGMDELANAFKASAAKAILCVIDCCFSGGAPARVMEDTPTAKDHEAPLEVLAGEGRVLIAACNVNEAAYESPAMRHGLLTAAILDVLQNSGDTVDLLDAAGNILEKVRAAASQLGISQTPVVLGYVIGGLRLPRLVPGRLFFNAFPDVRGACITSKIDDLRVFGIPEAVTQEWAARFYGGLNELQLSAVNDYRILEGESLLVIAPTSSGKTFIGEMAASRAITEGRKAVFLLPYRALVNEKFDSFQSLYGDRLGFRVIRCTGDYTDSVSEFVRGHYDVGLLTYEMFLNLIVTNTSSLNQIGLVVLDESQFITDPMRGISVELLLTFLLTVRQRGINPQLIALSATIGQISHFDEWLGCRRLISSHRPVPLIEGVLDRRGVFQYLDTDGQERTSQLLPAHEIRIRRDKPSAQDMIVPLVKKLLTGTNEKIIIFRNQRGTAEGCALYLSNDLSLPPVENALTVLPATDLSSTSNSLRLCLNGGTAFHNTNLTREEKQIVERSYRDSDSPLRVLGATTTVAAGINSPASTVILAEQEFIGEDGRPFTVAEYKNMAGRAGRLGYNEQGKSIILADTPAKRTVLFNKYVRGQLEPLRSSFHPNNLNTWIVRLLAQIKQIPKAEVVKLLLNTYGGYLANRADPGWVTRVRTHLETMMSQMLNLGLLEEELGNLRLSMLGRACGESSLSFVSAMRLVELVRSASTSITATDLMALVQALPESDNGWTPMMRRGTKENIRASQAAQRFSPQIIRLLQRHVDDTWDYYARCKRAAILADWIKGVLVEVIEKEYSTTPYQGRIGYGDIRRFADNTRFHLRAAHKITNVLFLTEGPSYELIDELLRQLEEGLPADALDLLTLPVELDRGSKLALYNAGIRTANVLWKLTDQEITRLLGSGPARALITRRPSPKDDA